MGGKEGGHVWMGEQEGHMGRGEARGKVSACVWEREGRRAYVVERACMVERVCTAERAVVWG